MDALLRKNCTKYRLRELPHESRASEEIERIKREKKVPAERETGEEAGTLSSSSPLSHFALSSPAEHWTLLTEKGLLPVYTK